MIAYSHSKLYGYFFSVLYCLNIAASLVFIHIVNNKNNPYATIFITFILSYLLFNIWNFKNISKTHQLAFKYKYDTFMLNVTTATSWITGFLALTYISPWLYAVLAIGSLPSFAYLINTRLRLWPFFRTHNLLILFSLIIIIALVTYYKDNVFNLVHFLKGVFYAVIAAIFTAYYMNLSSRYQKKTGMNVIQVLSVRFYILIATCILVISMKFGWHILEKVNLEYMFLISLLTTATPLIFLQTAINFIGPVRSAYFVPFSLLITYSISLVLGVNTWSFIIFTGLFLLCITMLSLLSSEQT